MKSRDELKDSLDQCLKALKDAGLKENLKDIVSDTLEGLERAKIKQSIEGRYCDLSLEEIQVLKELLKKPASKKI